MKNPKTTHCLQDSTRVGRDKKSTYRIIVFQGYDDNGKRRVMTETFRGDKKGAQAREADLKKHLANGHVISQVSPLTSPAEVAQ